MIFDKLYTAFHHLIPNQGDTAQLVSVFSYGPTRDWLQNPPEILLWNLNPVDEYKQYRQYDNE